MQVEGAPDGPRLDDGAGLEGGGHGARPRSALPGGDGELGGRCHLGLDARQPFDDALHGGGGAGRQALLAQPPRQHLVVGHLHHQP